MSRHLEAAAAAIVVVLSAATLSQPALAQDASATPAQSVSLADGYTPDPQTITLNANDGSVDASAFSPGCTGMIGAAADLRVSYTADSHPLVISLSVTGQGLLVRDPNGRWYCNAVDSGETPSVTFNRPQSGDYLIWVGGNSSGAALSISGAPPAQ